MNLNTLVLGCGLLCGATVVAAGCGSKETPTSRPLVDAHHKAAVLVEARVLSNPRSVEQNRLLRGWRFVRNEDGPRLIPNAQDSVIEIVHLKQRPRKLIIDVDEHRPGDTVQATIGPAPLGTFPVSDQIEIDLPADLPAGRTAVTLGFSNPETTLVSGLSISPNAAQGTASISPDDIRQSGWSAVEVIHHLTPGARLTAEFHPPSSPEPSQRFSITIENGPDQPIEIFHWDSNSARTRTGHLSVDVPLGDGSSPTRIHLVAAGAGPAGHWTDARIVEEKAPPVRRQDPEIGEPPRLVVLYVMDALRADHVGHLGGVPGLTPVLDHMASEGSTFSNHFAVAPNTPPSTRALFSGLCMLDDRQLPHPGPVRLAEVFRDAGYRTASITGNPHLSVALDLGTGFESVELLRVHEDHHPDHPPTVNNSAEILHRAALEWIDTLEPTERGFLYIHSMNPHNPYSPPPEIEARLVSSGPSTIDGRTRTLVAIRDGDIDVDREDRERIKRLYAAGVAYNDRELGDFMDEVGKRFEPREMVIAVTSDHGEELFEHDGVLHGYTLHDEMLRIPLIVRWPGRVAGGAVDSLTNTLDFHAALIELVHARPSEPTARSLWPELFHGIDPTTESDITFAAAPGLGGGVMARSDRWKLISAPRSGSDRGQGMGRGRSWDLEYVFDLANDPAEQHNLAGTPDLEIAWLRTRLMAWIETQHSQQPVPGDRIMDTETKDQLEALGYIVDP